MKQITVEEVYAPLRRYLDTLERQPLPERPRRAR